MTVKWICHPNVFLPPKIHRQLPRIRDSLFVSALLILISGCAGSPPRFSEVQQGQWDSRVTIEDKVKDQTFALSVGFQAIPGESVRMDLLTPSGVYVGSVAVHAGRFQALIAREKKFYEGEATMEAMQEVLKVPINPQWLSMILFDLPPRGWDCEYDESRYIKECLRPEKKMKISWTERSRKSRLISLVSPQHEVGIFLHRFRPDLSRSKAFQLEAPKGFRIIRIR